MHLTQMPLELSLLSLLKNSTGTDSWQVAFRGFSFVGFTYSTHFKITSVL